MPRHFENTELIVQIYFTDTEKAVQEEHTLNKKQIKVTHHQPLLAKKIAFSENFVKEKIIVGLDPEIMSFLCKNSSKKLKEIQTTCEVTMNWESGSSAVTLVPTTEQTRTSQWEESCEKFTAFISKFITRTIAMSPKAWKIFQEKSRELCQSHQDKVNITMAPDNYQTVVTGEQQDVGEVVQQVEDMKTDIEQEINLEASKVTDEIKDIPRSKLLLLGNCGFKEKLQQQHKDLEMDIFPEMGSIYFKGPAAVVHKANQAICQSLLKTREVTVELPHNVLELLKTEPGQLYIKKKFEGHSVEAIVVYENDGKVDEAVVLGLDQEHAKRAISMLKGATAERILPLTEEQVQMEKSQTWSQFKDVILDKRLLNISFEENLRIICLVGAKEDVRSAFKEISGFFKENTIVSKILPLPPGSTSFLFKHMRNKLDAIQQTFKSHSVFIKESREGDGGVMVSGTAEGVGQAMKKLQNVSASILKKTLKIDKPGMRKFFTEGNGAKLLSLVENEHSCIIDRNFATPPASETSSASKEEHNETVKEYEYSYSIPEKKKISLFKDNSTEQPTNLSVNVASSYSISSCHNTPPTLIGFRRDTAAELSPATADNPRRDVLDLTVYAGNKKDIISAEKAIDELVEENYKHKAIEHDAVTKLSSEQKAQIDQLQYKYDTRIEIEDEFGRVVIRGDPDDVLSVATEIYDVLNKAVEEEHTRGIAELLYENTQWSVYDDGELVLYDKDINAQIERAYRSGDKSVIFVETNERYEIVFKEMVETNLGSGEKSAVVRKEIGKGRLSAIVFHRDV